MVNIEEGWKEYKSLRRSVQKQDWVTTGFFTLSVRSDMAMRGNSVDCSKEYLLDIILRLEKYYTEQMSTWRAIVELAYNQGENLNDNRTN